MDFRESVVRYLTGDFAFSPELQAFWMALQGAIAVRSGPNKDRSMHWFHAFLTSVLAGYGGACFTPLWMGQPTSMLFNDLNLAACITAYIIVNCIPFDLGYKLGTTIPVVIVTTTFAQLFRSLGVVKYTSICYNAFKDSPSAYYPIPIFGPIAYGTLLVSIPMMCLLLAFCWCASQMRDKFGLAALFSLQAFTLRSRAT